MPYQNFNHYHHIIDDVWEGVDSDLDNWPKLYALFCPPNSKILNLQIV